MRDPQKAIFTQFYRIWGLVSSKAPSFNFLFGPYFSSSSCSASCSPFSSCFSSFFLHFFFFLFAFNLSFFCPLLLSLAFLFSFSIFLSSFALCFLLCFGTWFFSNNFFNLPFTLYCFLISCLSVFFSCVCFLFLLFLKTLFWVQVGLQHNRFSVNPCFQKCEVFFGLPILPFYKCISLKTLFDCGLEKGHFWKFGSGPRWKLASGPILCTENSHLGPEPNFHFVNFSGPKKPNLDTPAVG